jgi:UDP-glucose 4-epimerase
MKTTFQNYEINGKKIAITGASGYIGSSLAEELKKYSTNLIRVSRKKLSPSKYFDDLVLDLNLLESWIEVVNKVDIVFHLSGNTSIYSAEQDPDKCLMSTILPITHFVTASKRLNLKPLMVFASTATVYGMTINIPVSEVNQPTPVTNYDLHKYLAEQILINSINNNLINARILRLSNVYGPNLIEAKSIDRGVLSKITRMAFQGRDLPVYGGGEYKRDYIYITDVVSAFVSVASVKSSQVTFNVSTGIGTKVKEVFQLISLEVQKITKVKIEVNQSEWPKGISEIEKRNFIGSNDLLKSCSNWRPSVEIEEGIRRLVLFYAKEYFDNETS